VSRLTEESKVMDMMAGNSSSSSEDYIAEKDELRTDESPSIDSAGRQEHESKSKLKNSVTSIVTDSFKYLSAEPKTPHEPSVVGS
jgi:hypothetical protein